MSLNLLKPQHGLPKKPSEVRDNLQHILGAALPDCILPEDDQSFGFKITAQGGLTVRVGAGRGIIGKKYHDDRDYHDITLPARRACLLYKLKNTATDSVTPSDGYVEAKLPDVDANTIVRYEFSNWDGTSSIPNSAVGVNGNTIAVANALTKTGTVNRVDGYVGYAGQGDGSTGYFVSENVTNIPSGTNPTIEVAGCISVNQFPASAKYLVFVGSNNAGFGISIDASCNLTIIYGGTPINTNFVLEVGKKYNFSLSSLAGKLALFINGELVHTSTVAFTLTSGIFRVLNYSSGSYFAPASVDYIEIRNALRTPAQIAQISNDLLLPCTYQTPQSPVPLMTANSSQGCVASATTENASFKAYQAFRKGGFLGDVGYQGTATTGVLQITMPAPFSPKWMDIQAGTSYTNAPKDFTIYGSNDGGTTKNTLLTVTGATFTVANERKRYNILGVSAFSTLGISVTAITSGTVIVINDLDFGTDVVSTTDIRSILPANSISLGYAKTSSTAVIEIDSNSYKYGIRQGAVGGNRKVPLGWKYFSGITLLKWSNPFGTRKIKTYYTWAQDSNGTNESDVNTRFDTSVSTYGLFQYKTPNQEISIQTMAGGVTYFNSAQQTTGYIQCYVEVIE